MTMRALLAAVLGLALLCPAGQAAGPLTTGFVDPFEQNGTAVDLEDSYQRMRASGATVVRIPVVWAHHAVRQPANPTDPADRAYRWSFLDEKVQRTVRNGMQPVLSIYNAPGWAKPGSDEFHVRPSPAALGQFAEAAARRYSGAVADVPRVRYWQVWNEPNLRLYLDQAAGDAADRYREMVNATAEAVKRVNPDNLVIAGGLGPFGGPGPRDSTNGDYGARPLPFMRSLLCVTGQRRLRVTCAQPIRFDIWAHHPYTSGAPGRSALRPGDASLGDMPEIKRILHAARRGGVIQAPSPPAMWATEFSWDSSPPDPEGVPLRLHARWVAEALHLMWRVGISQATWFQLRDNPLAPTPTGLWQSGLYFSDGAAKPALQAFRFPFVAYRSRRAVVAWGRTPLSDPRRVAIEQRIRGRWRRIGSLRANRYGIFRGRLARRTGAPVRARLHGTTETSSAFSLVRPRNFPMDPFGTGSNPE